MKRQWGLGFFLLTALSPSAHAQDAVSVVGWNLAGFSAIPLEKVERFAGVISAMAPRGVLLLVEVNDRWIAGELAAELMEDPAVCYRRAIPEQPRANQEIALLHSCDVEVIDVRLIDGSDLEKRGYRQALAANVRAGEFDFVLVGLHPEGWSRIFQ